MWLSFEAGRAHLLTVQAYQQDALMSSSAEVPCPDCQSDFWRSLAGLGQLQAKDGTGGEGREAAVVVPKHDLMVCVHAQPDKQSYLERKSPSSVLQTPL